MKAFFLWPESSYKSPNCIHTSSNSPNSGHAIYYVVIGGDPSYKDIVNCMTRVRTVRRLMNTLWRFVRTFWSKKKCHHMPSHKNFLAKVLILMALSKVLMLQWGVLIHNIQV